MSSILSTNVLSNSVGYAQAKINEAFALKDGTSEQYDAAVKRSDYFYDLLKNSDNILSATVGHAQAKINEAFALKYGTSEEYDAAVKRSDYFHDQLTNTISTQIQ